jgi:pyoverdine/dityrosine biosynthesis protein Dit1
MFSKLHQVYEEIGCTHITILFDDIGLELPEDFSSLVDAQAFTMNKLTKYFDAFITNKTLTEKVELKSIEWTTCPTYYSCKFRNNTEVPAINYLNEFKEKVRLTKLLWTTPNT